MITCFTTNTTLTLTVTHLLSTIGGAESGDLCECIGGRNGDAALRGCEHRRTFEDHIAAFVYVWRESLRLYSSHLKQTDKSKHECMYECTFICRIFALNVICMYVCMCRHI